MSQSYTANTILRLGAFQSGKTSGVVKESFKNSLSCPNLVNVFIAHKTNVNKSNQEFHIKNTFGECVNLITQESDLSVFLACTEKNRKCFNDDYPIVISCLNHHKHLETLLTLVALDSSYIFDIYVDESDSVALDHQRKKSNVRKDNLVDSLLRQKSVQNFICLTATPFSEIASNLDWNEINSITPGEGYNSIDDSPVLACPKDAMQEFNLGRITPTIEEFLISQSKESKTVTLISTLNGKEAHHIQAKSISKLLPKNCLSVVLNSSTKQKYYVAGETYYVPTKRNRKGQLEELFDVAEKFDKLFIVGWDMLSRSVTLKKGSFDKFSGMLFSAPNATSLAVMLQRVARIAGYQDSPALLMTDKSLLLTGGLLQYPELLKVAKKYKKADERRTALFSEVPLLFPNIWGMKDNAIKTKTSPRQIVDTLSTEDEAKKLNYQILSTLINVPAADIPHNVLKDLKEHKKAAEGTNLHSFILNQHFSSNRVLEAAKGRENMALPNSEVLDNYRDTLYLFEDNMLKILVQPFFQIRESINYAIHNISTGQLHCYAPSGNFRL